MKRYSVSEDFKVDGLLFTKGERGTIFSIKVNRYYVIPDESNSTNKYWSINKYCPIEIYDI